jgi:hypothetical protein
MEQDTEEDDERMQQRKIVDGVYQENFWQGWRGDEERKKERDWTGKEEMDGEAVVQCCHCIYELLVSR